ncbi:YqhV family protein [Bacillus sp. FJAT-47783]|uniref:YqhV family protein n=1 Tax=Bacillus sp. FJAT-47783 TaxID=2922712 RepID=UPI001FAD9CAB|nr:YqhV family protein [Bacillus sp. FJAT-47783]
MKRFDPIVLSMAGVRLISSLIEFTAAMLMILTNDLKKAIAINSILAIVGPVIFIVTMTIGVYHIANELSYSKLIFITLGVCFILYGIFK